jgi:hypothetical protein
MNNQKKRSSTKSGTKKPKPISIVHNAEVSHTPIIINDGSASIDFSKVDYKPVSGTGRHNAKGLKIRSIIVDSSQGTHVCHIVPIDETCEITVVCNRNGVDDKNFVVRGSTPVEIEFDNDEYPETLPDDVRREIHRNENRTISAMTIRNGQGMIVHECDLVLNGKNRMITINDPHLPH